MNENGPKHVRLPLPRDAFRSERSAATAGPTPVVVMPAYDDLPANGAEQSSAAATRKDAHPATTTGQQPGEHKETARTKGRGAVPRNPFEGYGERSSARPYALRLPDAIDLTIRQMAAEERTQPLRIIDRILYEYLKRIGKLPPPQNR
jgi:hypothetical protein